jgi:hypothetical protein
MSYNGPKLLYCRLTGKERLANRNIAIHIHQNRLGPLNQT